MKFWVLITPPTRIKIKLRLVQKILSKKYNVFRCIESRFGSHITLTYQPEVNFRDIKNMEKAVFETSKNMKPITVKIDGIKKFNNNVIYARVLKTRGINDVNKMLKLKLRKFGKVSHRQFTPHITLAFFDITKDFRDAFKEMKGKKLSFSFKLERISIAKAKSDGRGKIYKTFAIKHG